jgi:hypothetical protein
MMKLFSEKVEPTFTSSNLNILGVRNFKEIFIDVFEFEINGKKFIAEKVSEHNGLPVVNIPIVLEGSEYVAPFVLRRGEIEVLFNRGTAIFIKPVLEEVQELIEQHTGDENEKVQALIENSINKLSDKLSTDISNKAADIENLVNEKIINLTTNTIPNIFLKGTVSSSVDDTVISSVNEKLETINESVRVDKERIYADIENVANETIQLAEKIDKNTNRALSRIGNVKVQLETSFAETINSLEDKLRSVEAKISNYYTSKITEINESVKDITETNKENIIHLITKSKESLLEEIAKVKSDIPDIVINNEDGKQGVNVSGIKAELEKIIGTKFTTEIGALKRLIEMSSGGGSVAKQFANGGTMDGNLIVTGSLSASNYLGLTVPAPDLSEYLPISGGTITNDLTVVGSLSASNYLGLTVPAPDLSQYFPLSGGTITGDTRFNSNVTVFGNLTTTGTTTFANTVFSVTSALSVVHIGSGPAVWVGNNGAGDIASFYDIDQGIEVLHIGGINSSFPNVGVNTSAPNKALTVSGEISATSDITTSGKIYIQNDGNSDQWNAAYTTVQSKSSNWDNAYNASVIYQSNSATYSTIDFVNSKFFPISGGTITDNLTVLGSISSSNYLGLTIPNPDLSLYLPITGGTITGELTVTGKISSTDTIYAQGGNSVNWNNTHTTYSTNSSTYLQANDSSTIIGLAIFI